MDKTIFEVAPHKPLNPYMLVFGPQRYDDGQRYCLYKDTNSKLILVGGVYAQDRRDAWHCFQHFGWILEGVEYKIL